MVAPNRATSTDQNHDPARRSGAGERAAPQPGQPDRRSASSPQMTGARSRSAGRELRGLDRTRASAVHLASTRDVVSPQPTGDGGASSRSRLPEGTQVSIRGLGSCSVTGGPTVWNKRTQRSARDQARSALSTLGGRREPRRSDRTRASADHMAPTRELVAPPLTGDGGSVPRVRLAVPGVWRTEGVASAAAFGPPVTGHHPRRRSDRRYSSLWTRHRWSNHPAARTPTFASVNARGLKTV